LVGLTLPAAPRAPRPVTARDAGFARRYARMLVAGLGEVRRVRTVRNGVLLAALLLGTTAYDEYFALLAIDKGAAETVVPLLVGVTVAGQVVSTALAGRTSHVGAPVLTYVIGVAGVLLVLGAFIAQPLAFAAIGVGYGMVSNATIVAESRLQDAIEGEARATVTSVVGLTSEVAAVAVFATFALASAVWTVSASFGLVCALVVVVAALTPGWLPPRAEPSPVEHGEVRDPSDERGGG
ncbi:MAG: MFS transporter, partial [Nocardioidaceae bacterium]